MAKLRIALYIALISSVMTGVICFLQGARVMTILYRTCISILIFSILGYLIGNFGQRYIGALLQEQKEKGQKVDADSQQESIKDDRKNAFVPLTPEKLERVSRPGE